MRAPFFACSHHAAINEPGNNGVLHELWTYTISVIRIWEAWALGAVALALTWIATKRIGKPIPNGWLIAGGIIIFFVASFWVWRDADHTILDLRDRLNPKLSLDIYEFGITKTSDGRTVIGLLADIANSGGVPSVCDRYLLSIRTPDGKVHHRQSVPTPEGVGFPEANVIHLPQNALAQMTSSEPVQPGDRQHGYLLFEIDSTEQAQFSDDQTKYILSCRDVQNTRIFYKDSARQMKTYTRFPG